MVCGNLYCLIFFLINRQVLKYFLNLKQTAIKKLTNRIRLPLFFLQKMTITKKLNSIEKQGCSLYNF